MGCRKYSEHSVHDAESIGEILESVLIGGKEYLFSSAVIKNEESRESYFLLAEKVFGLDFKPWYSSGFCGDRFIPYTLFDNGAAVSSVGVVLNNFRWGGKSRKYAQLSTVMTEPDYLMRGLSRWLTEAVIKEWKGKCDSIYLYANDTVKEFYPKFGFVPADEYRYSLPVAKKSGRFRNLDLSVRDDVDLLVAKHRGSNPFSLLAMEDSVEIMMFHCINFLRGNVFYVEEHDAIVIAEQDGNEMFCYDIYTGSDSGIADILGTIASSDVCTATLGFTPAETSGFTIEKANESDTTFFVLDGMENILRDNRVTFPFLSRA